MLRKLILMVALLFVLSGVAFAANWQKDLDNLISTTSKSIQDSLIKQIVSAKS